MWERIDKELEQALAFGGHCPKCNDFLYAKRVNGKIVKECIHCDYSEKKSRYKCRPELQIHDEFGYESNDDYKKEKALEEVLSEARSFKNDTTGVLDKSVKNNTSDKKKTHFMERNAVGWRSMDVVSHKQAIEMKEFIQSFKDIECPCCHEKFGDIKVFEYFYEIEHIRDVIRVLCPHCHSTLNFGAVYEFMKYGRSRGYIKPEIAIVKKRAVENNLKNTIKF